MFQQDSTEAHQQTPSQYQQHSVGHWTFLIPLLMFLWDTYCTVILQMHNKWFTDRGLNNLLLLWWHYPRKLTLSNSLSLSKTESLAGQKNEQLCSSSFLLGSDEVARRKCANETSDQWIITTTICTDRWELNHEALFQNMFWRVCLTSKKGEVKPTPGTCWPPGTHSNIKPPQISGWVVTLLTSHLFEPEQFRGLHLWWHDPSHPAQDLVASVGYTSGLFCSSVVHPHHHVPLSLT